MFEDTIAISQIFGVEARAHILVEGFKQRLAAVAAITSKAHQRWRVFVYDSGEDAPETAGRYAMPTALIEAAGARNVMDDVEASWTTVNWEAVLRRDPQFIVIIDYGDVTAAQKIAFLRQAPALAAVDAVRQDRFVILPYDAATPGVRNIDAVEILAHAFNSILP
jgi:iron complex transport system substrate-binding protein